MERSPIFMAFNNEAAENFTVHRHVLCPHYDRCLDEAVVKDLSFECTKCAFRKKNIIVYLIHDGMAA